MTHTQLEQYRSSDLMTCDPNELADLCEIRIDPFLPKSERMSAFLRQVGNPYLFKVDGLIVKAVYPPDAKGTLCDAFSASLMP